MSRWGWLAAAILLLCLFVPCSLASLAAVDTLANAASQGVLTVDLNGDGIPDWCEYAMDNHQPRRGLLKKLKLCTPWGGPKRPPRGILTERTSTFPHTSTLSATSSMHRLLCGILVERTSDGRQMEIHSLIRPMGP